MSQKWIPKINSANITEPKMQFVLTQAKDMLNYVVVSNDKLADRSYAVLGFLVAFANGLLAFLCKAVTGPEATNNWGLLISGFSLVLFYWIVGLYLFKNLKPKVFSVVGNNPESLLREEVFADDYKMMIYGEAYQYEERIKKAVKTNEKTAISFQKCLICILLSPILAIGIWGAFSIGGSYAVMTVAILLFGGAAIFLWA